MPAAQCKKFLKIVRYRERRTFGLAKRKKNALCFGKSFTESSASRRFLLEGPNDKLFFNLYTREFKSGEFGKAGATDLRQRSDAEAAQLE
jgi:hypothetical protein